MKFRARARHPRRKVGTMNKLEKAYADRLKGDSTYDSFMFEAHKFRLADKTWFTPDFVAYRLDGTMEVHEVKARTRKGVVLMEDDAAVKLKVFAELYPQYVVKLVSRATGGDWVVKDLSEE